MSDALRDRALRGLESAAAARKRGEGAARIAALEDAAEASATLRDAPLLASTCWRLAKARFDEGHDHRLMDALAPLLDLDVEERGVWGVKRAVGPFDHYPAGLRALPQLSQRHWDRVGYRSELVTRLWDAWRSYRHDEGEPYLVAWSHVLVGWQHACAGQLDKLRKPSRYYARQVPGLFEGSEHRHPRAPDAPASLWWIQLDLARTLLRGATWAGQERIAWEAREALQDAAEDAGVDLRREFWPLDALLRAADRFGWTDLGDLDTAYPAHAAGLPELHRLRLLGRTERDAAALERAWELGQTEHPGPEWMVEIADARARLPGGAAWTQRAEELAARTGVVRAG